MGFINDQDEFYKHSKLKPTSKGFNLTSDGNYDIKNKRLVNVAEPIDYDDVITKTYFNDNIPLNDVTKQYVDNELHKNMDNTGDRMTGVLEMGGNRIENIHPIDSSSGNNDATNLKYIKDNYFQTNSDLNLNTHKIIGLENNPDHKVDEEYSIIVKDVKSAVNKEYLNQKFLKKDKDGNYFDLKGQIIKNSEPFSSSYDNQSLVPKIYIDNELVKKMDNNGDRMLGVLDMGGNRLENLHPIDSSSNVNDATNKQYVDDQINTCLRTDTDISLNGYSMSTVKVPSTNAELTNKKYVDIAIASSHIDSSTNKSNVFIL